MLHGEEARANVWVDLQVEGITRVRELRDGDVGSQSIIPPAWGGRLHLHVSVEINWGRVVGILHIIAVVSGETDPRRPKASERTLRRQ